MSSATGPNRRRESGFTLIELMVVVLIIGTLLTIAIPTFLGARTRSQNTVAQTSVDLAAKALATAGMATNFEDFDPTEVFNSERAITWTERPSDGPKTVSVSGGDTWIGLAARSDSGRCFVIKAYDASGGVGNPIPQLAYGHSDDADCVGAIADKYATEDSFQ